MISPKVSNHRESITLALCQRDYDLMAEHHPDILDVIESAISDGISPETIKRWAVGTVGEAGLVQRVFNAARFAQRLAARAVG